ncbi:MAG: hypothetical protein ABJA67_05315 [Chthonomonadales bacterium]
MPAQSPALQRLADHWSIEVPPELIPVLGLMAGDVEILTIEDLLEDAYRTPEVPHRYIPFALYPDLFPTFDEWTIGIYQPQIPRHGSFEIVACAEGRLIPFASTMGSALYRVILEQRTNLEEAEDVDGLEELAHFATEVGISVPPKSPRNERERRENILGIDTSNLFSLTVNAVVAGRVESIQEIANNCSWYFDAHAIAADLHQQKGEFDRAAAAYLAAMKCGLVVSADPEIYGIVAPDGMTMYEWLHDRAEEYWPQVKSGATDDVDLLRVLSSDDPFGSRPRLKLAEKLLTAGDIAGAEREFSNALALSMDEDEERDANTSCAKYYRDQNLTAFAQRAEWAADQ